MTRRDYCHKLADIDEALYDNKNELRDIKLKIMMEDDPERKEWFINARERLLQEKKTWRMSVSGLYQKTLQRWKTDTLTGIGSSGIVIGGMPSGSICQEAFSLADQHRS